MLRTAIALIIIMLYSNSAVADSNPKLARSFETFIKHTMTEVIKTYEGEHYNVGGYPTAIGTLYTKSLTQVDHKYKYDLEKSNSVINPYIGTLEVNIVEYIFESQNTEQLAAQVKQFKSTYTVKCIINFKRNKNNWVVLSSRMLFTDGWKEIDPQTAIEEIKCNDTRREIIDFECIDAAGSTVNFRVDTSKNEISDGHMLPKEVSDVLINNNGIIFTVTYGNNSELAFRHTINSNKNTLTIKNIYHDITIPEYRCKSTRPKLLLN